MSAVRHHPSRLRGIAISIALAVLGLCAGHARAHTFGSDLSDFWWNPNESGWGLNVAQQQEVLFLSLFVYGFDNRARWYSAAASYVGVDAQGTVIYSGALYESLGPPFAAPFVPGAVVSRVVGTATFAASALNSATLAYTIDGNAVSKSVTRLTFRTYDVSGTYIGGYSGAASGCSSGSDNGAFDEDATFDWTHSGSSIAMRWDAAGRTCNFNGTYQQTGRIGRIESSFACSDGESGQMTFVEVEVNQNGMTGRFVGGSNACQLLTGRLGGVRR
jgi:hypothetical protein